MEPMKKPQIRMKRVTVKAQQDGHTFEYLTYRISGMVNGRRVRLQFNDRNVASHELAKLQVAAMNANTMHAVMTRLPDAQVAEAESCLARLRPIGKPLSFAVEWFLTNYRESITALPVSAVKDQWLAEWKARGIKEVTLRDYKQNITRFADAMGARPLPEITATDVINYLGKTGTTRPKSWNNDRADLNTFFVWAMKAPRRWITHNPVSDVEKRKVVRGLPDQMTAEQVAAVMKAAETFDGGSLAGFMALAFFAGLRPSIDSGKIGLGEIYKLATHPRRDEFINFGTGYIIMAPELTKTSLQRQVKMEPNLVAWLKRYPLQIPRNMAKKISALRELQGMKGRKDVTRHTYVSMHVSAFDSIGQTSQQAGNSEAMIKRHYLNVVSKDEALRYWRIAPS
jgi:site-specific recombinase XerC